MTRIVLDIPNDNDLQTLIPLFQRLGISFASEKKIDIKAKALEIVKAGCDMSNFGDALAYQREVRQDRVLPFRNEE